MAELTTITLTSNRFSHRPSHEGGSIANTSTGHRFSPATLNFFRVLFAFYVIMFLYLLIPN